MGGKIMILSSLGIIRYIDLRCRKKLLPQNSVVAVGIDREKMATIIQGKNIKLSVIEKKLGLSKSRYYRWINYDVDLPFEYTVGLKKLLGLSDNEFLSLILPSTDEVLDTLALAMYFSSFSDKNNKLSIIMNSVEKYRNENQKYPFKFIILYLQAFFEKKEEKNIDIYINKLDKYLESIESITDFDLFLNFAVLQLKQLESGYQIEKNLNVTFINKLLEKMKLDDFSEVIIFHGFIIDIVINLILINKNKMALEVLNKSFDLMINSGYTDEYSKILDNELSQAIQKKDTNFEKLIRIIKQTGTVSEDEILYWSNYQTYIQRANS